MTKTYLTPNAKGPEFIIVPMGAVHQETGVKLKRKVIQFQPNARNVGQFVTADPAQQKWLEEHEWFKVGKMVLVTSKVELQGEEPTATQATGPRTSEAAVRGGKRSRAALA